MPVLTLDTPLKDIRSIGPKFLKHLEKLKIKTAQDLLFHFPFRYEDFSQQYNVSDLEPGQQATIQGAVQEVSLRRSWRKRMIIVEAIIEDGTGSIRAVWFNQPFVKSVLRPGRLFNFSGKISVLENELYLSNPTYEFVKAGNAEDTAHTGRLVPIYSETRGLTSKGLRFLIQPILKNIAKITEWIPEEILEGQSLPEINDAVRNVHFPKTMEEAAEAKKRFAFEDLFLLQVLNLQHKMRLSKEQAPSLKTDIPRIKKILESLPFELTLSQKKSLWEILQDMEKQMPMNRLLQGDVGSGKTVVAALAGISTAMNGCQTALMAPTEVLARQHFETMKKLLPGVGDAEHFSIGLRAGGEAKLFIGEGLEARVKRTDLEEKAKIGELSILIGTHSLIGKSKHRTGIPFKNLGLVIVDEQHRFGVEQRAALTSSQGKKLLPHFLSMSATPIPRTLMLTVFGDLDISTIDELPQGRKKIVTRIVPPEERSKAYEFIRREIKKGQQAFVICPRIEKESEETLMEQSQFKKLELKSVKEEYEKLSKKIFPDLRVGMLHGQMPASKKKNGGESKEEVMRSFKEGRIDVLVTTSVVEVGVDVPNATVMMIEGSERFGLAQLYQFRGRVGRGEHQSYCLLFTDSESKTAAERLKAIIEAKNGFELAEKDLSIRGPGQFLGTEQTGLPDLAMRGLQDIALIKESRTAAVAVLQKDQTLKSLPELKKKLSAFQQKIHLE